MRNFKLRRFVAFVMIAIVEFEMITPAFAGLDGELDAMWNTTQAQAYSNSHGMGVFGGSMSIRTPVRNFTLIAFDPPHLEYGCAGMDVHFGSFSMLNGEQIKVLTRAIVQAAAVYLVHLAIASVCKECDNQLSKFMKMAQDIASATRNTCALGKSLANAIADNVGSGIASKNGESQVAPVEAAKAVAKGTLSDTFSSMWDQFSNGSTSQRASSEDDSTGYGNLLANSMLRTGGFDYMNTQTLGGDAGAMSILMSVFGTELIATADQLKAATTHGTGSQSQQTTSAQSVPDRNLHYSMIKLEHIRNGTIATPPPTVLVCQTFDKQNPKTCQNIDSKPMMFTGIYRYVVKMIAGDQNSLNGEFVGIQSDSIAWKIKMAVPLSGDEIRFLRAFSVNSGILLTEASGTSGSTYESLVERIINLMADEMTVAIGRAMVHSVKASFPDTSVTNDTTALPMPSWMQDNMRRFEAQLNSFLPESQWEVFQRQVQTLQAIRSMKRFASPNLAGGKS